MPSHRLPPNRTATIYHGPAESAVPDPIAVNVQVRFVPDDILQTSFGETVGVVGYITLPAGLSLTLFSSYDDFNAFIIYVSANPVIEMPPGSGDWFAILWADEMLLGDDTYARLWIYPILNPWA